jgi:hypothetical protein
MIGTRYFGNSSSNSADIRRRGTAIEGLFNKDIFREFDDLYREMTKMYNTLMTYQPILQRN